MLEPVPDGLRIPSRPEPARDADCGPLGLVPLSGVEGGASDTFVAATGEPWLEVLGLDLERLRGRLVEFTYRASLLDQPTRPLLRFFLDDGSRIDKIAPAPFVGSGCWVGRMPRGVRRVAVSPVGRAGTFGFRMEGVVVRSWRRLVQEGFGRRPRQARSALLTRLIGWAPESDNNLAWATGAFDFASYGDWHDKRRRASEPRGLDTPRHDASAAPPIVLIVEGRDGLDRTCASLVAQAFGRWRLLAVDAGSLDATDDPRIVAVGRDEAIAQVAALPAVALVGRLAAGDAMPPYALAFLDEQRRRDPCALLFYGDELVDGRPVLKPGWSPRLMAGLPYLGRAVFALAGWSREEARRFVEDGRFPSSTFAETGRVRALRRILLERTASPSTQALRPPAEAAVTGSAAIVIPTCDQPALLGRVVASIRARTPPGTYRLMIVDNGRADGPARALVDALASAPDATVLRRGDPFNFSGFCNDAVAACDEPVLVFLNDDTAVLSEGWLARLSALALQPDVGAVGARLTYPDGRLQHAGVLVGMGGSAGHLGAMAPGDDPGWLGRNAVVHEVSAVTGACLAVARDKFLAVGGFDAEALPVELSDIDLCLKLNARGWQTLVEPAVHLLHEESASRGGATFRRLTKYSRQRDIFVQRWRHVLRDDPFFHPGLSLYSLQAALG